jgi:hypothetical protein
MALLCGVPWRNDSNLRDVFDLSDDSGGKCAKHLLHYRVMWRLLV